MVPVDLVVDHSVLGLAVGRIISRHPQALRQNMEIEFARNRERYRVLKWGMQAFDTFKVVPPRHWNRSSWKVNGTRKPVCQGIRSNGGLLFQTPGRDGLPSDEAATPPWAADQQCSGVVGHRLGYRRHRADSPSCNARTARRLPADLARDVIGVERPAGSPGITATDLVLAVTEMLRREKVVGKFVEFFGEGTAT